MGIKFREDFCLQIFNLPIFLQTRKTKLETHENKYR